MNPYLDQKGPAAPAAFVPVWVTRRELAALSGGPSGPDRDVASSARVRDSILRLGDCVSQPVYAGSAATGHRLSGREGAAYLSETFGQKPRARLLSFDAARAESLGLKGELDQLRSLSMTRASQMNALDRAGPAAVRER